MRPRTSTLVLTLTSVLLFAVGVVSNTNAQDQVQEDEPETQTLHELEGGGSGFFSLGTHFTSLGSLNDRLAGAGYPSFASEMFTLGGGGYGISANGLMLGGEGHGLISGNEGYQGRSVSVGGGYGLFTVGYLLRPQPRLRLYPQVGLGGGRLVLAIGSTDEDEFDDVLENPGRSATLSRGSFLISLGAGVEYQFRAPDDSGGFQLGLRAGYVLAPYETSWELGDSSLSSGPDATIGGPFVRLFIGAGGIDRDE